MALKELGGRIDNDDKHIKEEKKLGGGAFCQAET